jgi:hypothetical protein
VKGHYWPTESKTKQTKKGRERKKKGRQSPTGTTKSTKIKYSQILILIYMLIKKVMLWIGIYAGYFNNILCKLPYHLKENLLDHRMRF